MIFGIGTDILHIPRIEKAFQRHPQRFAEKLLSPLEQLEYQQKTAPDKQVNYLAKRWAVKEAFAKACGTGLREPVLFPHISLVKDEWGKPNIQTADSLTQWLKQLRITATHVSLSDEVDTIIAFVILEKHNHPQST